MGLGVTRTMKGRSKASHDHQLYLDDCVSPRVGREIDDSDAVITIASTSQGLPFFWIVAAAALGFAAGVATVRPRRER